MVFKEQQYFLLVILALCLSCNKKQGKDPNVSYNIGFKIIQATDSTRLYKPDTELKDKLHFRLVDIDVWYPAKSSNDSVLRFGNILGLLEQRANVLSAPQTFNGITKDIAKSFCEGFGCSQTNTLLNYPTRSFRQAEVSPGKFPLIIYLASYNAMSYDNYVLLEDLANQGYVVACVSSIGRYPGNMSMKKADLMEQVNDAAFVLNKLKRLDFVDSSKIGLVGYSWGGFAGAILAMSNPEIKAIVSLDGSEFHHYGSSKEEDLDFDTTVNSSYFKNASINVPYLRFESDHQHEKSKMRMDSIYNFTEKLNNSKEVYKIKATDHQDFSCLPFIVKDSGNCKTTNIYNLISNLTIQYFNQNLKQEKDAFSQALKPNLNKTITPVLVNN